MASEGQAIWAALAAVQTQLKTQQHTRRVEVGKYGYTYTELSALADYLLPILGAAGIATTYTSELTASGDALEIECRLTAGDGSYVSAATVIQPASWGAQDVGKVLTYGRRYCLQMASGIATEADDDNAPQGAIHAPAKANPAPKMSKTLPEKPKAENGEQPAAADGITEPQKRLIFARVRELCPADSTDDDVRALCTKTAQGMFNTTVSGLTKKQASGVIEWLQKADYAGLTDDLPF